MSKSAKTYIRRDIVEAMQVLPANIDEVSRWSGLRITMSGYSSEWIEVDDFSTGTTFTMNSGDYLVQNFDGSFSRVDSSVFDRLFVEETSNAN